MKRARITLLVIGLGMSLLAGCNGASQQKLGPYVPPALGVKPANALSTTPAPQMEERHQRRYVQFRQELKAQKKIDMIFLGDSITYCWRTPSGQVAWKEYYSHRNVANIAVGGAKTENVLWQIANGFADGYHAKLAVLMIGTNNSRRDTPAEIAAGVRAILVEWFKHQPQSKVLLLAIFPRGATPADPQRQVCEKANALIRKLGDNKHVFYMNINDKYLDKNGTLSRKIMPDLLHPESVKGYRIWAEAIEPFVEKVLGDKR